MPKTKHDETVEWAHYVVRNAKMMWCQSCVRLAKAVVKLEKEAKRGKGRA
jgi:hypothetical protein